VTSQPPILPAPDPEKTPGTRERILAMALELFSTKGYDATSVREICDASGIAKPTLYHFYGSKEGVYRALVDGLLLGFHQRSIATLATPGTAAEKLKRMGRDYFSTTRDNRKLMRFVFGLIHNPPSSAPVMDIPAFYEEFVKRVAAVVDDGVHSGELRPGRTDLRMLVLMGALSEAVCGCLIVGRPLLEDELADELVESIVEGWRAA
jgi:TetR/AcrR family transcriptional regulator